MGKGRAFKKVPGGGVLKLTDQVIEDICNNLRLGSFIETSVVMAGVPKETFYGWIREAHKRPRTIYARLLHAVEKAQEEATTRDLLNIDKCAMGAEPVYMRDKDGGIVYAENGKPIILKQGLSPDWQASRWRLSKRVPHHWGESQRVEMTGKDGGPIETSEETADDKEKRKQRVEELLKKRALLDGR